jgi:hypothetical protein
MPLVMKDALKWPDLATGHGRLPRTQPLKVIPRYFRKRRIRHSMPRPGYVPFGLSQVYLPASLNRKIRQLSVLDDRSLSELVVLGLTWVVTYWAAARLPKGTSLESVRPFRRFVKTFGPKPPRGKVVTPGLHTVPRRVPRTECCPACGRFSRKPVADPLTTVKMVEEGGHQAWQVLANAFSRESPRKW